MRKLLVTLLALSTTLVLGGGYWAYNFCTDCFPDVRVLKTRYPVMYYREPKEEPLINLHKIRPAQWTTVSEVSPVAVGAIIVSEDWAFYQHKGYDANQIKEAIKEDLEAGRFRRGASTITQQMVKNVFLEKDKNLFRKFKELILAMQAEERLGKRRILENYLNIAEWGEGIYGIRAASQHYFQKSPGELTAKEGAFLAMLLPSPKKYSVSFRQRALTDYARETVDSILDKMTQARYITEEQRDVERAKPLSFEGPQPPLGESAQQT